MSNRLEKIINAIFSFSGASIAIGTIGFASAIVTMFVDVNKTISIPMKLAIFISLVILIILIILLKLISDLSQKKDPPQSFEVPIQCIPEENGGIFVIRRSEIFINSIVVGGYIQDGELDRLLFIGEVFLVQEKIIQIKAIKYTGIIESISDIRLALKMIKIKPVVPVGALGELNQ